MFRQREVNPHFLPRQNDPDAEFPSAAAAPQRSRPPRRNDPVIEFPLQPPSQQSRPPGPPRQTDPAMEFPSQPPPIKKQSRRPRKTGSAMEIPSQQPEHRPEPLPPHHAARTSIEPHYAPKPQAPMQQPKPLPPHQVDSLPQHHQEFAPPHPTSQAQYSPATPHRSGRGRHRNYDNDPSLLRVPTSRRTKPFAWLVAAFCAVFWMIVIVGGLIILTVYLIFRPRNPRFDISGVTLNAAYLDMGYLLNADLTVLTNFTNPNTKVNVDYSYVIFELHFGKNFIATQYVEPFSVLRRESSFIAVHLVSSQVRLSMADSLELQREIERGRVNLEIKGMFRAKSKLGGIFQYSYWINARCQVLVTSPPTGVMIGKRCTTK